jgi:hypothetical protein
MFLNKKLKHILKIGFDNTHLIKYEHGRDFSTYKTQTYKDQQRER